MTKIDPSAPHALSLLILFAKKETPKELCLTGLPLVICRYLVFFVQEPNHDQVWLLVGADGYQEPLCNLAACRHAVLLAEKFHRLFQCYFRVYEICSWQLFLSKLS